MNVFCPSNTNLTLLGTSCCSKVLSRFKWRNLSCFESFIQWHLREDKLFVLSDTMTFLAGLVAATILEFCPRDHWCRHSAHMFLAFHGRPSQTLSACCECTFSMRYHNTKRYLNWTWGTASEFNLHYLSIEFFMWFCGRFSLVWCGLIWASKNFAILSYVDLCVAKVSVDSHILGFFNDFYWVWYLFVISLPCLGSIICYNYNYNLF